MKEITDKKKKEYMKEGYNAASFFRASCLLVGLLSLFFMLYYPIQMANMIYNTSVNWNDEKKLEKYVIDVDTGTEHNIYSTIIPNQSLEKINAYIEMDGIKNVAITMNLKSIGIELIFIGIVIIAYLAYKFLSIKNLMNPFNKESLGILNKIIIGISILLFICVLIGNGFIVLFDSLILLCFIRYIIYRGMELINKK